MVSLFSKLTLSLDKRIHLIIRERFHELHRYLVVLLEDVHNFLHTLLDDFEDSLFRIHLRLLFEVADAIPRGPYNLAAIRFFDTGNNL